MGGHSYSAPGGKGKSNQGRFVRFMWVGARHGFRGSFRGVLFFFFRFASFVCLELRGFGTWEYCTSYGWDASWDLGWDRDWDRDRDLGFWDFIDRILPLQVGGSWSRRPCCRTTNRLYHYHHITPSVTLGSGRRFSVYCQGVHWNDSV